MSALFIGNSSYIDTLKRYEERQKLKVHLIETYQDYSAERKLIEDIDRGGGQYLRLVHN